MIIVRESSTYGYFYTRYGDGGFHYIGIHEYFKRSSSLSVSHDEVQAQMHRLFLRIL